MKKISLVLLTLTAAILLQAYEVMLLGDIHYDTPETRLKDEKLAENQENARIRNFERWEKNIPAMLDAAGKRSAQNVAFVVQLGDIIHGGCGNEELQTKAFQEVLAVLKKQFSVPLYVVKGNHDIHGPGAEEAFAKVMLPYLNREFGQKNAVENSAHYAVMHDKDLFIYFDSMKPDADFVEQALDAHKDARHVFFLTHLPVIPSGEGRRPDWIVYGLRSDNAQERQRLLKLLARRNAIVLCGHIHRTVLSRYRSADGTITQFTSFGMPVSLDGEYKEVKGTGEDFLAVEDVKNAMKTKRVKTILNDFTGKITEYDYYLPGAGYNVLRIDDNGVFCDLYFGANDKPSKTLKLSTTEK